MKNIVFFTITTLLVLSLTSCETDKWYQVPPETADYVHRFQAMAEKRGYDIDIEESGLIIEFGTIEESLNSKLYYEDPIRIVLDKTAWETFNEEQKALEINRNLALGFLNRQTDNEKLPNGEWKSLMRGQPYEKDEKETLNFFGFRQDYYINELFYKDTEMPWWADYTSSYDSLRMQAANETISEDVSLDSLDWTYISAGLNINFENGELILKNETEHAKYVLMEIENQLQNDFLIEAIIKIKESNDKRFSGLIWGGAGINTFYVNGYNAACESRMHNMDENYDYCHFADSCSTVIPDGYNKISIRKSDEKYHFFINEKFIYITDIHKLYGNKIGFYVGEESIIHINRLSIKTE